MCRGERPGKLVPARGTSGDKPELLSEINAAELNAQLKTRSSASANTWIEKCGGLDPKPRSWDPAPGETFPSHPGSVGKAAGLSRCFSTRLLLSRGLGWHHQVEDTSVASSTSCFFNIGKGGLIGGVVSFLNPTTEEKKDPITIFSHFCALFWGQTQGLSLLSTAQQDNFYCKFTA